MNRLCILLLILLISSCQLVPEGFLKFTEKKEYAREYYPSGQLKALHEVNGIMRHGLSKYYYESGKLQATAQYNMNKYHGEQISYYTNGQVRGKLNWVDHKKQGEAYAYYEDGSLYMRENYNLGRLDGVQEKYYDNGKLMMETSYKMGSPSIYMKEYTKYGKEILDYPELKIEAINRVQQDNRYLLKIYFSNKSRSGEFYINELVDGEFLPNNLQPLEVVQGVATYIIMAPPGAVIRKEINIIAAYQTKLGHRKIYSMPYQLAITH